MTASERAPGAVGRWLAPVRAWTCECPANLVVACAECPDCHAVRPPIPESPAPTPDCSGETKERMTRKDMESLWRALDAYGNGIERDDPQHGMTRAEWREHIRRMNRIDRILARDYANVR